MNDRSWYLNRKWNASIEKVFFEKLNRARSSKYQYLYTQAARLAKKHPKKSLELFDLYFEGKTDNFFDSKALLYKAQAHISLKEIEQAVTIFEKAISLVENKGKTDTQEHLQYVFFLASSNLKAHYPRALSILQNMGNEPLLMWEKFKYYTAYAIILYEDKDFDKDTLLYIERAIDASEQEKSGLSYHQKVGLVVFGQYSKEIRQLKLMKKNITRRSTPADRKKRRSYRRSAFYGI